MLNLKNWHNLDVPQLHRLPSPVYLRSENLGPHQGFAQHAHPWNQFVYATSGTLLVSADTFRYVITPEQAIWIPTGTPHTTGSIDGASFRNLYVSDMPGLGMPKQCTVYGTQALLRELIIELQSAHERQETKAYQDQLKNLLLEQIKRLHKQDFHLPWPQNSVLQGLCEALQADPAHTGTLELWAKKVGCSPRTLARRFEAQVGMSLRAWRHKLRLFLAIEWLGTKKSITNIALDLGYSSVSAFTYMFRQETGCSPTQWRHRNH